MLNIEKYSRVQTACLKVEKVVGHGLKAGSAGGDKDDSRYQDSGNHSYAHKHSLYSKGWQSHHTGTVHKQIFYIGTDGLEHHLAEDIDFSELVDVEPLNPMCPVREGMNQQDFSVIENSVFEFDPIPVP